MNVLCHRVETLKTYNNIGFKKIVRCIKNVNDTPCTSEFQYN